MGIYQKIGLRGIALSMSEMITWIRLYGFRKGFRTFRSLSGPRNGLFKAREPFRLTPVLLRDNFSDPAIFRQVFMDRQYVNPFFSIPTAETIIDAGANVGLSVLWFAHCYPTAAIIAIEPETKNFEFLTRNTSHLKNVRALQAALWGSSENVGISNPEEMAASFSVTSSGNSGNMKGLTITDIMQDQNWHHVDILKIDIEGAEKEVFGAENTEWLKKVKHIIIELHDQTRPGTAKTFFDRLAGYNYNAYFHHENILISFDHA